MRNTISFSKKTGIFLLAAGAFLSGCASNRSAGEDGNTPAPVSSSNDILELLTGFGESISKRNFERAVQYLVPEDRNQLLDKDGKVPEEKQKALMALPLQKLIRNPSVHVERGYLAGIYAILARQDGLRPDASLLADPPLADSSALSLEGTGSVASDNAEPVDPAENPGTDPALRDAMKKFFSAVRQKNWSAAMALMDENERRVFMDDKGRITEAAKARLSRIDASNKNALTLQDGKLTGVTLLVPND